MPLRPYRYWLPIILLLLAAPALPAAPSAEERAEALLRQMTLDEKLAYIGGDREFYLRPLPRLGLPEIRMADGPLGCRNLGPSTCYPAGIALAATWNPALARQLGEALGRDCRARGVHVLLAPGVNLYRSPLCGRNFEYLGEDPCLAASLAVPMIRGIQSQEVLATVKHFAANNQEWDRNRISSELAERVLRELYLPAFRAAVQEGQAACVMSAYNLLNGVHCTQHEWLNNTVLKGEWGFGGILMSDWDSTYDGVAAANGGLDLEMPSGKFMNAGTLRPALAGGKVSPATLDDKVRRLLRTIVAAGFLDRPQKRDDIPANDPAGAAAALAGAREALVLLKNEDGALPLDRSRVKRIAVVGPNAHPAVYCAGGSAYTTVFQATSIREGLRQAVGPGLSVDAPSEPRLLTPVELARCQYDGPLTVEYFNTRRPEGEPVVRQTATAIDAKWTGTAPAPGLRAHDFAVRWSGRITPPAGGPYLFVAAADDGIRVYLEGRKILDDWSDHGFRARQVLVNLEGRRSYNLRVEYYQAAGGAAVQFGWRPCDRNVDRDPLELAAKADAAVVCVGFNPDLEGEGRDRSFALPSDQVELIRAVAAVNKRTIVVLNAGGGVAWEGWLERVPAVLHAWYSGQAVGQAVAEVLLGDVNPSGRLPISCERRLEDNPSSPYYTLNQNGKTPYTEGLFMGYRGYDRSQVVPQFGFGHGLSYTRFEFRDLQVERQGDGVWASVSVRNVGQRAGQEVVQFYVGQPDCSVPRPLRELKGFAKVALAPGESQRVGLLLPRERFAFFHPEARRWTVEPGAFVIEAGHAERELSCRATIALGPGKE